ncbi:hypothetical protein, conserved, partial [Trypanosoma cruzi]
THVKVLETIANVNGKPWKHQPSALV